MIVFSGIILVTGRIVWDARYSSTAKLNVIFVNKYANEYDGEEFFNQVQNLSVIKSCKEIANSNAVIKDTVSDLHEKVSLEQLAGMVSIEIVDETNILKVTLSGSTKEIIREIAPYLLNNVCNAIKEGSMGIEEVKVVQDFEGIILLNPRNPKVHIIIGAILGALFSMFVLCVYYGCIYSKYITSAEELQTVCSEKVCCSTLASGDIIVNAIALELSLLPKNMHVVLFMDNNEEKMLNQLVEYLRKVGKKILTIKIQKEDLEKEKIHFQDLGDACIKVEIGSNNILKLSYQLEQYIKKECRELDYIFVNMPTFFSNIDKEMLLQIGNCFFGVVYNGETKKEDIYCLSARAEEVGCRQNFIFVEK
jgi:Capsular polysaccharide biosynthesis protein